jgi:hypothetical protein
VIISWNWISEFRGQLSGICSEWKLWNFIRGLRTDTCKQREWVPSVVHSYNVLRLSVGCSASRLVHLTIYDSTALVNLGRFFSFLILYTVYRTPWMVDQLRRKAATYAQNNTKTINVYIHPCLEWESNLRKQYSSRRPLWSAGWFIATHNRFTVQNRSLCIKVSLLNSLLKMPLRTITV